MDAHWVEPKAAMSAVVLQSSVQVEWLSYSKIGFVERNDALPGVGLQVAVVAKMLQQLIVALRSASPAVPVLFLPRLLRLFLLQCVSVIQC